MDDEQTPSPSSTRPPAHPRSWVWTWLPPLGVFLVVRFFVTIASPHWVRPWSISPTPWTRVDAFNYLDIATFGRRIAACPDKLVHFFHGHITCGTAAWLPGYPYVLRGVHELTGMSVAASGVLMSTLFALAALMMLWGGVLKDEPRARGLLLLLLFAVFPGAVYNFAIFPNSMALAGIVGTVVALRQKRVVLATVAMVVAAAAYPSVIYAFPAFAFALIAVDPQCRTALRVVRRVCLALLALTPYVALWIHDQVVFHRWNLYSQIQSDAGVTVLPPKNPLSIVWHLVVKRDTITQVLQGPTASWWIAAQFLIATMLIGTAVFVAWRHRRLGLDLATEFYPVLIGLSVYTGVFLSGTTGGVYRGIVIAAPAVLIFRRVSTRVLITVLIVTTIVTIGISTLYFDRTTLYNALNH
ncbi:MAG: hypothetical protein WCK25_03730 [Actinomycetes bacterium]